MPIYEYACEACGHEFEREQRITADPVKTCPDCRSRKVQRLISRTSFILKGSGWYPDLYSSPKDEKKQKKADGAEPAAKEAADSKSEPAPQSDSKPDSKPDTKSDAKSGSKSGGKKKGSEAAA